MKISLLCHLLFPGDKYMAVAYPIQTAMSLFWAISANGHLVQLVNASDLTDKMISRLKRFQPDLVYNLAEGLTNSRTRQAFFPELLEKLGLAYIGGDGFLRTTSLDKYLAKKIVADLGIKTPKSNLYYEKSKKGYQQIGDWQVKFPVIVKPNSRGDSEGIDKDSLVLKETDLKRILQKRLKQFPEGVLVEEFIKGREIGVAFLKGIGTKGALFPVETVVEQQQSDAFKLIDYNLKNYAIKSSTNRYLSIRLADDLPVSLIRKITETAVKIFEAFKIEDFCRVDFRLTDSGEIYFLELNPVLTMKPDSHTFLAAEKKQGLSYKQVIGWVIKKAAERWGLRYYEDRSDGLAKGIRYRLNNRYYRWRFDKLVYQEP